MIRRFSALLAATALCSVFGHVARAQTAPSEAAPATVSEVLTKPIRVQNVAPSLIAWWLDPANHPEPPQMRNSREVRWANPLITDKTNPKKEVPPLPAGIERLVAINPQNALLVSGTAAGFSELEKVVALLDQPIRQVEVSGEFVQISPEEAKKLGIPSSSDPKKRYSAIPLSAGTLARIAEMKAQKKLRLLSAPRVIAISGLTGALSTTNFYPGFIDIRMRAAERHPSVDLSAAGGQMLGVITHSTFAVQPTVNADNSIRLQLAPARFLELSELQTGLASKLAEPLTFGPNTDSNLNPYSAGAQAAATHHAAVLPLRVLQGAQTEITMQDGQTIALSGFTSDFFSEFVTATSKVTANVVILVTPRIIRRAGDEVRTAALQR